IISREFAVTGLRAIAVNEGIVIHARTLGKYKTIFQAVSLLGLCLHYSYYNVDFHVVGMTFLWGALVLTVWSAWDYFRQFRQVLFAHKQTKL
ncbi:MAG: CDP-alcohol phosphatidyltransferase family protein, partial [Thermodesulfobacteriota bacterium]|nr:CDP-alcohol phosphatidyltransferase family protein [Thermodesulfobacteriota bacterium]